MIRTVDLQVAYNAIPDHARQNFAEQASLVYRQMQNLAGAREENLIRPERVAEVVSRSGLVFQATNSPAEPKKVHDSNRSETRLYSPEGTKKSDGLFAEEEAKGHFLDISA